MVARTPLKEKRMAVALNPNLVRETVKKVDKCMARLQDLHYTVTGGSKVVSGVRLSPNSTKGYLRTSLRCKQESMRLKNAAVKKSPPGKFPGNPNGAGEWRRMSLPAMLLGETIVEILKANQFTKEIADAAAKLPNSNTLAINNDPKTPDTIKRQTKKPPQRENTELRARHAREKKSSLRRKLDSPTPLPRARSRIVYKPSSPLSRRDSNRIGCSTRPVVVSQKVSPKNRPWSKKTVLFPNALFVSSSSSSSPPPPSSSTRGNKFYKTRSPIIARTKQQRTPPHKFKIKSPSTSLKSQMKNAKAAVPAPIILFSPVKKKLASSSKVRRCSFSPSKLAKRLVSPLRCRISLQRSSSSVLKSGFEATA